MKLRVLRSTAVLAVAVAAFGAPAGAQDSKRPIRLLVPSPPGGPSDFAARLITPKLSEAPGRNLIVEGLRCRRA